MKFQTIIAAAAIAVTSSGAFAATLTNSYAVTSAESSQYNSSGGHSVWLPKETSGRRNADHFDFTPAGVFNIFDDGSAELSGTVTHETSGSDNGFTVSVLFQEYDGPLGGKLQLRNDAYAPNGPVDPTTWDLFSFVSGTLEGFGTFAGSVLNLQEKPVAADALLQIGVGANGKNINFGGSSWFDYTRNGGTRLFSGDFNVDLTETDITPPPAPVPLPASALLLLAGLGGLGAMRRRK